MLQLLQETVLVLLIAILTGVSIHETPQNVPPRFQKALYSDCLDDSQAQPDASADEGRNPALNQCLATTR